MNEEHLTGIDLTRHIEFDNLHGFWRGFVIYDCSTGGQQLEKVNLGQDIQGCGVVPVILKQVHGGDLCFVCATIREKLIQLMGQGGLFGGRKA
jgi:hypothetical protein